MSSKEYSRQYKILNKESIKLQRKRYRQENKERIALFWKEYYAGNKEYLLEKNKKYKEENEGYSTAFNSRNRKRMPKWANKEKILAIYKEAKEKGLEVDHIIPLNSKLVCGLHVHNNLQLLTSVENKRKQQKFEG